MNGRKNYAMDSREEFYIFKRLFTPRTGHSVVSIDEKLYLFCGSDNENILNDFYIFDTKTNYWA